MAKTIFHPGEVTPIDDTVFLSLSKSFVEEVEEEVVEEAVYEGPTAEELRQEAEEFREKWEIEKREMLERAQREADEIIEKARQEASSDMQLQMENAQALKADSEEKAQQIISEAEERASTLIAEAESQKIRIEQEARETGRTAGHEEGFKSGYEEVERLVSRLHLMIEKIMEKREEILEDTERQIVDLVLLMTRKVVKVLSENDREVLKENVLEALRRVKNRGDVILHVNTTDIKLASDDMAAFIAAIEKVEHITVVEDSSVDQGGCLVETDFGSIDARIASQLAELEQKILEISPIRSKETKQGRSVLRQS